MADKAGSIKVKIDFGDGKGMGGVTAQIEKDLKNVNSLAIKATQSLANITARTEKNSLYDKLAPTIERANKAQEAFIKGTIGLEQYAAAVANVEGHFRILSKEITNTNQQLSSDKGLANLQSQITDYLNSHSNVANNSDFRNQIDSLLNSISSGSITTNKAQAEWAKLRSEFKLSGAEAETSAQKIAKLFSSHASSILMAAAVNALRKAIQDLYQNVVSLDGAMTDLQIASGMRGSEVKALAIQYAELGKQIGVSTAELLRSADSWSRQGYGLDDIETLIQNSAILSKVGKVSTEEATKYLTSAMKGFNVEAEDSIQIIDKLSTVDMNAAVSAGGLAEAMARTASSADLAGISMDRLIGYIATVGEVTQREMSTVGESFKTLFARMGNIKAGRLIDPETEEDLSDVEATLRGLGITLRDSANEFRNFGEVFDEIGSKWDNFSNVQQRSIAVALGGTRMQENLLVLMQNYDKALDYTGISADSSGKALEKYAVYQDSIASKQASLTAAFEEFSMAMLDDSTVKRFLDILTNILSALTFLTPALKNPVTQIIAITAAVTTLTGALKKLGSVKLFQNIGSSFKGLGRPKTLGFTLRKLPHAS